jgi:hypothetical protein
MAKIVQQTISITVSKLVKNDQEDESALTEEQLIAVVQSLPSVVEQLIDDTSAVVEVTLE